jgi:hypothetical protein
LGLDADTQMGNLVGLEPRDVLVTKYNMPRTWFVLMGKAFKKCAFTGTIRPDETAQLILG